MTQKMLFDDWPQRYEEWFTTPTGRLVLEVETALVLELLAPQSGDEILDAGCGTGMFTVDFLAAGATVTGLDLSAPMLAVARTKAAGYAFTAVQGDMTYLPFPDEGFDKTVSITALEFVTEAEQAVAELFRVTKPGGVVVVATLNSLSPWAVRRRAKTERGEQHVLEHARYRSPKELLGLSPVSGIVRTAVHFAGDDPPERAREIERLGQDRGLDSGAFVVARWEKPLTTSPPRPPGAGTPSAQPPGAAPPPARPAEPRV